ncbi:Superoxide dismutase [Fe] [bacterium HR10]|uniref:superoxide dismutase n=1 Tax=uncultured Acidobacteriota bacterium TaxID=171953 RepID=H5SQ27_9BACT|nr:superoxide dismutase, Fe-Mn family [uncultured Acidobacteriota bacterium]GBC82072.1 Superoxide dismutase [Fe] [bacterium HR10]
MTYTAKNYEHLLGMEGFSDQLLRNHFTLYQGYVTNTNKLAEALAELAKAGKAGTPEYAELKRRFGWEFNGMRLHELYFENLTRTPRPLDPNSRLARLLREQYGSVDAWREDFKASGLMRGIGWVVLYRDPVTDRLWNTWINEHDLGHLAGCTPLLIMDVFEHAYMLDYGLKKADYIEAFFRHLDWEVVAARLG